MAVETAEVVGTVLVQVLKRVWTNYHREIVDEASRRIGEETRDRAEQAWNAFEWELAARRYGERLVHAHSKMRTIGNTDPIQIEDHYVNIGIRSDRRRSFVSRDTGIEDGDATRDCLNVLQQQRYLYIYGAPGGGKTTLLRHLILRTLAGDFEALPIYVGLNKFSLTEAATGSFALLDFIRAELDIFDFPSRDEFIEAGLKDGRFLVLLDGLDEVSASSGRRDRVMDAIESFSMKYDQNHFVVTCRSSLVSRRLLQFSYRELVNLSSAQVKLYIQEWFDPDEARAERMTEDMFGPRNKRLLELAGNPLQLSMLCIAYGYDRDLPQERVLLYRDAVFAALLRWDLEKGINRDFAMAIEDAMYILGHVAYDLMDEDPKTVTLAQLQSVASSYIDGLSEARRVRYDDMPSDALVRALIVHHGILVQVGDDTLAFAHTTYHEYFAAHWVLIHTADNSIVSLTDRLYEGAWREVFVITAGLMPDAGSLARQMAQSIRQSANDETQPVQRMLNWVGRHASSRRLVETLDLMMAYFGLIFLSNLMLSCVRCGVLLQALSERIDRLASDPALINFAVECKSTIEVVTNDVCAVILSVIRGTYPGYNAQHSIAYSDREVRSLERTIFAIDRMMVENAKYQSDCAVINQFRSRGKEIDIEMERERVRSHGSVVNRAEEFVREIALFCNVADVREDDINGHVIQSVEVICERILLLAQSIQLHELAEEMSDLMGGLSRPRRFITVNTLKDSLAGAIRLHLELSSVSRELVESATRYLAARALLLEVFDVSRISNRQAIGNLISSLD